MKKDDIITIELFLAFLGILLSIITISFQYNMRNEIRQRIATATTQQPSNETTSSNSHEPIL